MVIATKAGKGGNLWVLVLLAESMERPKNSVSILPSDKEPGGKYLRHFASFFGNQSRNSNKNKYFSDPLSWRNPFHESSLPRSPCFSARESLCITEDSGMFWTHAQWLLTLDFTCIPCAPRMYPNLPSRSNQMGLSGNLRSQFENCCFKSTGSQ